MSIVFRYPGSIGENKAHVLSILGACHEARGDYRRAADTHRRRAVLWHIVDNDEQQTRALLDVGKCLNVREQRFVSCSPPRQCPASLNIVRAVLRWCRSGLWRPDSSTKRCACHAQPAPGHLAKGYLATLFWPSDTSVTPLTASNVNCRLWYGV